MLMTIVGAFVHAKASQDWWMTSDGILPCNLDEGLVWVTNILTPEATSMFL